MLTLSPPFAATVRSIHLLSRQFVLGRSIEESPRDADEQQRERAALRRRGDPAEVIAQINALGGGLTLVA